jgi:hypothetical protein
MVEYISMIYPNPHFCKICGEKTEPCRRVRGMCMRCSWNKRNHTKAQREYRRRYYKKKWEEIKKNPVLYAKIKKRMCDNNKKAYRKKKRLLKSTFKWKK